MWGPYAEIPVSGGASPSPDRLCPAGMGYERGGPRGGGFLPLPAATPGSRRLPGLCWAASYFWSHRGTLQTAERRGAVSPETRTVTLPNGFDDLFSRVRTDGGEDRNGCHTAPLLGSHVRRCSSKPSESAERTAQVQENIKNLPRTPVPGSRTQSSCCSPHAPHPKTELAGSLSVSLTHTKEFFAHSLLRFLTTLTAKF